MKNITISEQAYKEFKEFLDENKVESYNIRINLAGMACSGPVFNITIDESTDDDVVEVVNDVNFIIEKLVDEFGGFRLLSSEENGGRGLSLKPVIEVAGGCGSCGGGCGH